MKEILRFLRELERNNNREWFQKNKAWYQQVQQQWYDFCLQLIEKIGEFDSDIASLTIKDCTYRIYRDTRFSNDKTPYKTHFGVFLAPGGKKSMHAGYYFHVGTNTGDGYPYGHMLASGNYCYDPAVVRIVREDIYDGWESFHDEVLGAAQEGFFMDTEGALKRIPRDFPAEAANMPCAEWLKQKNFCLSMMVDDDFLLGPELAQRVADMFRTTKPFNDFINRAVDYVREGGN